MKKAILLGTCLLMNTFSAQQFETIPIMEHGAKEKRIKLVIMGDGFTANEQDILKEEATKVANYLFTKAPYSHYKNYFNVYLIKTISSESGVKHPGTAADEAHVNPAVPISNPNNLLETSFDHGGVHRCIYTNDVNKVGQVLASNFPDNDIALVIGNTTYHGGCGGKYPFITRHPDSHDVALHELGHTFGHLADEYWFAPQGESKNKTQNSDPASIKWKNWLGFRGVGIYPHAEDPSWFRPHENCEMRYLHRSFCSVCMESLIEKIHTVVSPIDSYSPDNTSVVSISTELDFKVNLILPEPSTLSSSWLLNGVDISTSLDQITIQKSQLQDGVNSLVFNVEDKTTDVRVDHHETLHISTVQWNIKKDNLSTDDLGAKQIDFKIYPNPTNQFIFIETKQKLGNMLYAEVLDLSGKQVLTKRKLDASNKYAIDLGNLPHQTYLLNIYNDKTLIISKKIIKD